MPHIVEHAVNDVLKPAGFRKAGNNWYRDGTDTVLVLNLQRSMWSRSYYLNFGLWLKDFGEVARPKEYQCPIRKRMSGVRLAAALDYEQQCADDERRKHISAALKRGLAIFTDCDTKGGILKQHRAGKLKVDLIDRRAQEALRLSSD
jgi:hypothetical protein